MVTACVFPRRAQTAPLSDMCCFRVQIPDMSPHSSAPAALAVLSLCWLSTKRSALCSCFMWFYVIMSDIIHTVFKRMQAQSKSGQRPEPKSNATLL